jgi:hypothetical protein
VGVHICRADILLIDLVYLTCTVPEQRRSIPIQ